MKRRGVKLMKDFKNNDTDFVTEYENEYRDKGATAPQLIRPFSPAGVTSIYTGLRKHNVD
jgi:hypothetical protein